MRKFLAEILVTTLAVLTSRFMLMCVGLLLTVAGASLLVDGF